MPKQKHDIGYQKQRKRKRERERLAQLKYPTRRHSKDHA